jgi:inosine-uridine nucleoside N-ribohydrolase
MCIGGKMRLQTIKLICSIFTMCFSVSLHAEAVWIDTDPACGISRTTDVDDCWALHIATHSPELKIRGISTVFGNSNGAATYKKAQEIVLRYSTDNVGLKIFRGADRKLVRQDPQPTEASMALAEILTQEKVTIIALGPVTNIATLLQTHPELTGQINRIIAVAGKRDQRGLGFYPGDTSIIHLHDFNFRKDVEAFDVILNLKIPIVLIPYEVASKVSIIPSDLEYLKTNNNSSRWLADISQRWLSFWQDDLNVDGFFPFDSLAVVYAINNTAFRCEMIPTKIERRRSFFVESRDNLIVSHNLKNGRLVTYCHNIDSGVKHMIMSGL